MIICYALIETNNVSVETFFPFVSFKENMHNKKLVLHHLHAFYILHHPVHPSHTKYHCYQKKSVGCVFVRFSTHDGILDGMLAFLYPLFLYHASGKSF